METTTTLNLANLNDEQFAAYLTAKYGPGCYGLKVACEVEAKVARKRLAKAQQAAVA